MTLPQRSNYTPGEKRRERKYQLADTAEDAVSRVVAANAHPGSDGDNGDGGDDNNDKDNSNDNGKGGGTCGDRAGKNKRAKKSRSPPTLSPLHLTAHTEAMSDEDAALRQELLDVLSCMAPQSPEHPHGSHPTRLPLNQATEERIKALALLRNHTEQARQRLLEDPYFQQLPNRDEYLSFTALLEGHPDPSSLSSSSSSLDPLDQLLMGMARNSTMSAGSSADAHALPQGPLDPQWVSLFHQADASLRPAWAQGMGKLDHADLGHVPELKTAMQLLPPDGAVRDQYQRAVGSVHDWGKNRLYQQLLASAKGRGLVRSAPSSPLESPLRQPPKKRTNLSKHAKAVLRTWFDEHLHHPYPTEEEKDYLGMKGGITIEQVNNWFINTRGRKWKPMINRLMAQKEAGGECKLIDQMVEKIEEPYHSTTK